MAAVVTTAQSRNNPNNHQGKWINQRCDGHHSGLVLGHYTSRYKKALKTLCCMKKTYVMGFHLHKISQIDKSTAIGIRPMVA